MPRSARLDSPGTLHQRPVEILAAKQIYIRSARLTAAALAGLVCILSEQWPIRSVRVVAEGMLFYSRLDGDTRYSSIVKTTCNALLEAIGLTRVRVIFTKIREANLVGTAIAALS